MSYKKAPRARETRSAAAAIADALQLHGITNEIRANRLTAEWSDIVGPRIAARARPVDVRERVLTVEVASSAWLHELTMMKTQLEAQLIERLGEPKLFDKLKLQLAGRKKPETVNARAPAARKPRPPRPFQMPATGASREKIVREVGAVEDEELREIIAKVRIENDK